MPVAHSVAPPTTVSLSMASASGVTNPSTTYVTLNAVNTHHNLNNIASNSSTSVIQTIQGGNTVTTKYIQLQSPRPTSSTVANHQTAENVSSVQNTITAAVRPAATMPPGIHFY